MVNQAGYVENPSAKILFTQVTQTAPGQCGICGKGQAKEGFVDTGLDFEFWGKLYLCFDCVSEIAAVFGFISQLEWDELVGEKDLNLLNYNEALGQIAELEKIIDGFTNLRNHLNFVSTGTLSSNEESAPDNNEAERESIRDTSEHDESIITDKQSTDKPVSRKGFLNIQTSGTQI